MNKLTVKEKLEWVKKFYKAYPLKKKLVYSKLTDSEIEEMYSRLYSHAQCCNILDDIK